MTTWNDVQAGDWVRGKDGALWGVIDRRSLDVATARFTMRRTGKADVQVEMRLSATGPEIARTGQDMETNAITAVQDVLGGRVLSVENDGKMACPPDFDQPGALLAHLHLVHAMRFTPEGPEKTLSELNRLHDENHRIDLVPEGYVEHHHTPDYLKRNADA